MIDNILNIILFFLLINGLLKVSAGEYKTIDINRKIHDKYLKRISISTFKANVGQSINKKLEEIRHI